MFLEKSFLAAHPGGTHKIAYSEYPGDKARTIICMHGLSRNGHDFDWLAQALTLDGYRVICPDMAGRGRSDRLENSANYNYPQYLADVQMLLTELGVERVDWIGTSMGGLMGMMLAATPNSPIKRLVINDVGPFISAPALLRIKDYVGINPYYRDWESYDAAFRKRFQSFGVKTEGEWEHMARISAEHCDDGRIRLNYDPRIVDGITNAATLSDVDLWPLWAMITQQLLILRGGDSDVLSSDTMHRMMIDKQAEAVTFAGVGHAPALLSADQIRVIRVWLQEHVG